MKLTWLMLLVCAITVPAVAKDKPCHPTRHAKVPVVAKLQYSVARERLIAAGWKPVRTKDPAAAASDPDVAYGNGPDFWRRGYVEVESCAGTGLAQCSFLFEDSYGNRLRVVTAGEELPDEHVHAHVTGARFVCQ